MNKRKKNDVNALLTVNAIATCKAGSLLKETVMLLSNPKNGNIRITPTILKADAAQATNFEIGDNFKLTIRALVVMPHDTLQ